MNGVYLRRTSDFVVGAILPWSNIDKVEQGLAASKTTNKIFKYGNIVHDTDPNKHICEALDVGVNSTQDAGLGRDGFGLLLDVIHDGCLKLGSSTTATLLALADVLVSEDHSVAIDKDDDKGIARLRPVSMPFEAGPYRLDAKGPNTYQSGLQRALTRSVLQLLGLPARYGLPIIVDAI
jgi:hypothetical protein